MSSVHFCQESTEKEAVQSRKLGKSRLDQRIPWCFGQWLLRVVMRTRRVVQMLIFKGKFFDLMSKLLLFAIELNG